MHVKNRRHSPVYVVSFHIIGTIIIHVLTQHHNSRIKFLIVVNLLQRYSCIIADIGFCRCQNGLDPIRPVFRINPQIFRHMSCCYFTYLHRHPHQDAFIFSAAIICAFCNFASNSTKPSTSTICLLAPVSRRISMLISSDTLTASPFMSP